MDLLIDFRFNASFIFVGKLKFFSKTISRLLKVDSHSDSLPFLPFLLKLFTIWEHYIHRQSCLLSVVYEL